MSYTQTSPLHPNLIELLDRLPPHVCKGWINGETQGNNFFRVDFTEPPSETTRTLDSLKMSYGHGKVWDERGQPLDVPIVTEQTLYIYVGMLAK